MTSESDSGPAENEIVSGREDSRPSNEALHEITLNRAAWNAIGKRVTSPYTSSTKYMGMVARFCEAVREAGLVLDLGCGPGVPFTRELVGRGFRIVGVDFAMAMLAAAKRNVPEGRFVCTSMTDIAFESAFDGVFCSYSMLCLDPENFAIAARRMTEALKEGGLLFVSLNEREPEQEDDGACVEVLGAKMYSRSYCEGEICECFSRLGMRILEVGRDLVSSREYGDEHTLMVLMMKR